MSLKYLLFFFLLNASTACKSQRTTAISVKKSGAKGDGKTDDTQAIQAAIDQNAVVYLPKGVYLVSHLTILDNKRLKTDGFSTILRQEPNPCKTQPHDKNKALIHINGSNVTLDSLSLEGDINSYDGQQNHAVLILPIGRTIENIVLKGVKAKNFRGDGVCIAGYEATNFAKNVRISNVFVENCYRNGISITTGETIQLNNIRTEEVGLFGIDIEQDDNLTIAKDIQISNVQLAGLGISGHGGFVENVSVKKADLDGKRRGCTVHDFMENLMPDGIAVQKAQNLRIEDVTIKNFGGFGIRFFENTKKGESLENISNCVFKNILIKNCASKAGYTEGAIFTGGAKDVTFDNLKMEDLKPAQTLMFQNAEAGQQQIKLRNSKVKGKLSKKTRLITN
jgi:polygalacturonase